VDPVFPPDPPTEPPIRIGAAFWLQRTDWPSLRAAAEAVEAAGFDDLWVDDHLLSDEGEPRDPKLESFTTLAAIAAVTRRVRLGHLVAANTFRNPALVAKMIATIDEISTGRAILGLGAGWFELEHTMYGFDFGASPGERIERLAEAVSIVRRLLAGERFDHRGRFYELRDASLAPLPVQPRLPILIGGSGPRRTLPLVARSADLWNAYGRPEEIAAVGRRLVEACREIGRDPASIEWTATLNVVIRSTRDAAEAVHAAVVARHRPQPDEEALDLGGPPELVAEGLRRYAAVGVRHTIWVLRSPWDRETIERLPEVRAALGEPSAAR
jgi:F420-dependent oxidoreductase-like protein